MSFVFIFVLRGGDFLNQEKERREKLNREKTIKPTKVSFLPLPTININKLIIRESIFLPSWQLSFLTNETLNDLLAYEKIIFFGNLDSFLNHSLIKENQRNIFEKTYFTLKIDDYQKIEDEVKSKKLIEETINIVKNYNFSGIVLDLEISGLFNVNQINNIHNFVENFYTLAKKYYINFSIAVYGDNFYWKRIYDLKKLNNFSDEIMIMAYDFSKSYGLPGPNFPFSGKEKYRYSFQKMIDDFLKFVPAEKITVIFGMYGYQWLVDEEGRSLNQAKALTLRQIKDKFYPDRMLTIDKKIFCKISDCFLKRDDLSKEVFIDYQDNEKKYFIWFEDEESVEIKKKFLIDKGITSFSFWAFEYF